MRTRRRWRCRTCPLPVEEELSDRQQLRDARPRRRQRELRKRRDDDLRCSCGTRRHATARGALRERQRSALRHADAAAWTGASSPAVAFVHGSGPTTRAYLPDLQELLVRNGVAVLAYDKRGTSQSGGQYPGESPTATAIDVLARDAEAAARFLSAQPEIDRARVGLAGHSQAGWIVPLAATRESAVRFSVLFSGPAVTADENDVYQDLAGQGERPQQLTDEQVDAEVLRHGPGGVDPMPWIRSLHIPALWLYGGLDKHIPSRLSARRLEPLVGDPGRDFRIGVFPNANHALVETTTGLTSEMIRSDRFAPGLFPRGRVVAPRARALAPGRSFHRYRIPQLEGWGPRAVRFRDRRHGSVTARREGRSRIVVTVDCGRRWRIAGRK